MTTSQAERWRDLPGWEGYYRVSDHGRVLSMARTIRVVGNKREMPIPGGILQSSTSKSGYNVVRLSLRNRNYSRRVHRLVLEAFVGPCPPGMMGCHNNGNPSDNRLENLRWDTMSGNQLDSVRHGTHIGSRETHCKNGHEFTAANTYRYPSGIRECRACNRKSHRQRRARKRFAL